MPVARIAFNLAFIDSGPLSGPGYYAVQLFENILKLNQSSSAYTITGYVQKGAMKHFSSAATQHVSTLPDLQGRVTRAAYEQIILPFRTILRRTDILFSPAFVTPLWGGRKLVTTIHDMYYRVIPEMTEPFQRKYWSVMIPVTGYLSDRIITVSGNSKKDIETYIPAARGKTVSTPLASRFEVSDEVESVGVHRPFVLMVANLTPNKNCGIVVEALALLRRKGREVSFVHAGKDHLGLLRQSIADNDAGAFVSLLGKVSDEELASLYRSCLAVVVPSFYEGFGMPAVEAQAMGTPLICSDRGALPEAAGQGALFFDPEDATALANQIESVLDLPQDGRNEMIKAGYDNVRQFSWEKTARETMAVFDELLSAA